MYVQKNLRKSGDFLLMWRWRDASLSHSSLISFAPQKPTVSDILHPQNSFLHGETPNFPDPLCKNMGQQNLYNLLVVSVTPYFLEKQVFWFEENLEEILRSVKTQQFFQDNTVFLESGLPAQAGPSL